MNAHITVVTTPATIPPHLAASWPSWCVVPMAPPAAWNSSMPTVPVDGKAMPAGIKVSMRHRTHISLACHHMGSFSYYWPFRKGIHPSQRAGIEELWSFLWHRQEACRPNKLRSIIELTKLSTYYVRSRAKRRPGVECHHMASIYYKRKSQPGICRHISGALLSLPWSP